MNHDASTISMLLAAQNAGNGSDFVHSLFAPGEMAGLFVVALVVVIGLVWFIFGDTNDQKPDLYITDMTGKELDNETKRSSFKK